jgi:hypothetical protein
MDLNSMFQNLGPAGGAMLTGMQMRDTQNEQESQQAYRQAQMDEIMQRTAQQKLMNPLELQAKQQGLDTGKLALETGGLANKKAQLELDAAPLEIQVKNLQRSSQLLGAASTYLSTVPPVQRHAALKQYAVENGINMNSPTIQGLWNQLSSVKGEEIPKVLNSFRENVMKQESTVYSHLEGLRISGQNQKDIEGMRESAKAKLQAERGSLEKSLQQDLSAARTYQAQSVVYGNHAAKARLRGDTEEATRLEALSKEANIKDLQKSAAAGDAQAAQKLQALQMVMGGGGNLPPSAPMAPASSAGPVSGTTKSGAKFTVTPTQ